jgi:hypothetical protein
MGCYPTMDFMGPNSSPQIGIIVLKKETIARWLVLPVWQRHGLPGDAIGVSTGSLPCDIFLAVTILLLLILKIFISAMGCSLMRFSQMVVVFYAEIAFPM